jgi:hypothetical protein
MAGTSTRAGDWRLTREKRTSSAHGHGDGSCGLQGALQVQIGIVRVSYGEVNAASDEPERE